MSGEKRSLRVGMMLLGIFLMGTGVACMVKSRTGTSAITSLPTILNVIVPQISLGTFTFLLNMLFFLGQFLVEPGSFRLAKLLQIVPTFFLGLAVDVNMWLLGWWVPPNYALQLATLLCGVVIFGLSLAMMISANVILMPIDSFMSAVCRRLHMEFGNVKTGMDVSMVILSTVVSLLALHRLVGVREGTVVAAVCVGQCCRLWRRFTDRLAGPKE